MKKFAILILIVSILVVGVPKISTGEVMQHVLATGVIPPFYFENGTPIVHPYAAWITINDWHYEPNTTSLVINVTGIFIQRYIEVNGSVRVGKTLIVSGYVLFYIYISKEFPRPSEIYEVLDNGSIIKIPFSCREDTYTILGENTSIPAWYVEFTLHFSNPTVVIKGRNLRMLFLATVTVLLVVAIVYLKRRGDSNRSE